VQSQLANTWVHASTEAIVLPLEGSASVCMQLLVSPASHALSVPY
jgi:hypothetical protein